MPDAIVTISIGDSYRLIAEVTHPWMRDYASRIDAEFIILSTTKYMFPHYEKFRIYSLLEHYNRIIYLDVDTLITPDCPDLFKLVPDDCLGIYDEGYMANSSERVEHEKVMQKAATLHDIKMEKEREFHFYNTGVMVISQHHRDLFAKPCKEIQMEYMEQPYINLRVLNSNIEVRDIGYKFNRMPYVDDDVKEHKTENYIIHYAGQNNARTLVLQDINNINSKTQEQMQKQKNELIMATDRITMLDSLNLSGKKCVEVGTHMGNYSQYILDRNPSELWLIDPWVHQSLDMYPDDISNLNQQNFTAIYYQVLEKFDNDKRVHILRDFSMDAALKFNDKSFDFVYIDAIHTFESCFSDIITWYPKVKKGGWLCGHDYTGSHPSVKYAVDAFLKISGYKLNLLAMEKYASWGVHIL